MDNDLFGLLALKTERSKMQKPPSDVEVTKNSTTTDVFIF